MIRSRIGLFLILIIFNYSDAVELEVLAPYVYENNVICFIGNGCLQLTSVETISGEDSLGSFTGETEVYATFGGKIVQFGTRTYAESATTVYSQTFVDGLTGTSMGDQDGVSTGFPVFRIPSEEASPSLRFITPSDSMVGWTLFSKGHFWSDHTRFRTGERAGIVGLIEQTNDEIVSSTVMSAITEPMAVNNYLKVEGPTATLHWGVQGLAENIPEGFTIEMIVINHNSSFVSNVLNWGDSLLRYHGTSKITDTSTQYLSYWTDNGAYHYYNADPFDDFEMMFKDLYDQTTAKGVPFRHYQIDSWWYHKGTGRGLKNWTEKAFIFPNGIDAVHSYTGIPLVAHNRYFASNTDYAQQNGGDFLFTIDYETDKALPLEKSFWEFLFDDALQWGLYTYEQDWLDRQYEETSLLHTNITLASAWLNDMGSAALERSIPIQYCMSLPRHALHSTLLPAVTHARVSEDYLLTGNQWKIGHSSLFSHALGLKPYKDVLWTNGTNKNNDYAWCEFVTLGSEGIRDLQSSYVGRENVTESGTPCIYWDTLDYQAKYPHQLLYENYCRDPGNMRNRTFCFTEASLDTPEETWLWEFCDIPFCEIDCYIKYGYYYLGDQSITQSGANCSEWNGEFGLDGAMCRNPNRDQNRPWCFVNDEHTEIDFCDNQCPEGFEENSELQSAVATLSAGPVGIGDRESYMNTDLVMKSCRGDGRLLQPQKPLTVTDHYFLFDLAPEIWTADVSYANGLTFGIIFIAGNPSVISFSPSLLNLESAFDTDVILWENYPEESMTVEVIPVGSIISLPECSGYLEFCLMYTSPLMSTESGNFTVLGERSKWTPVSDQRIVSITIESSIAEVQVIGTQGETVDISFWSSVEGIFDISCSFTGTGLTSMIINVFTKTCQ